MLSSNQNAARAFSEGWQVHAANILHPVALHAIWLTTITAIIVVPQMQAQGTEQEQAAITLGASGWQVFRRVTLPNIKWAPHYGAVLCTARAVGEFGGVSVVSGNIRGQTNTLPLHVELLFNDLNATVPLPPPPP